MKARMTIKKQLVIALLVVGITPFVVMSITSYMKSSSALNAEAISKMEMSRDLKKDQLIGYFRMLKGSMENMGENRQIHLLYDELVRLHIKNEVAANEPFRIINDPETKSVYAKFDGYFGEYMKKNDLSDVYLICSKHGHIMYSVGKDSDLGQNLVTGELRNSKLHEAWEVAIRDKEAHMTDMAAYGPSNGNPNMFMAIPIIEDGVVDGVIAVKVNPDSINKIMQTRIGMGKTGETYLVGQDKLMRSDSFLNPTNYSLINSFKNPSTGSINNDASTGALSGKTGTIEIMGSDGEPMLSAYTPFEFLDLRWSLIAEIDESEVFAAVISLRNNAMIMGLVFLGLIIALALFLGRFISNPISRAVESITSANSQVVSAAGEISESSQALAEGASQQASSIEEVSATVEEATAINNQNADNSREADILAKDTKEAASEGFARGTELMAAMQEINNSSERIAKIIKTIDEIASQTKLLALNAAVEAARAGEHGLGFAVVADEVKGLAQRSANAATETSEIIEQSIKQIRNGLDVAKKTNEAFGNIDEKIKKTSNLISEISISTKEQSEGMSQIAQAMGNIDQVTQQNAATSEEAAAASEELNAQAVAMQDMVAVIAAMVGIVGTEQPTRQPIRTQKTTKNIAYNQPKRATIAPKKASKGGSSDVFPLDDEDLKEF
ncbi:MAG: methyl-accepting chemotaxis protein [Sulfurimonas sp.]|nr:methyl-accepting chemotaxis protein [Sulfurimonas sp.]